MIRTNLVTNLIIVLMVSTCLGCSQNCTSCTNSSFCYGCERGYYIDVNFSCSSCQKNCYSCNAHDCTQCNNQYFLNKNNSCTFCSSRCFACNGSTCWCNQGYGTIQNICLSCSINCVWCSAYTCYQCSQGYYLTNGSCYGCSKNCLSCSASICYQCTVGYYQLATTCQVCSQKCLQCSASECYQCQLSYRWFPNGTKCITCLDSNCYSCTASGCNKCNRYYYLNGSSCVRCSSNCWNCSALTCYTCYPQYYYPNGDKCSPCPLHCAYCKNASCSRCYGAYYLANGNCYSCSENCLSCNNATVCIYCNEDNDYYLNGNICSPYCYQYHYLNQNNTCSNCLSNCLQCTNKSACIYCHWNYYLHGNICLPRKEYCLQYGNSGCLKIKPGYYMIQTSVFVCPSKQNCNYCTPLICSQCPLNYFFACCSGTMQNLQTISCNSCSGGYYRQANGNCINCPSSNCETCNSEKCLTCISKAFTLIKGECSNMPLIAGTVSSIGAVLIGIAIFYSYWYCRSIRARVQVQAQERNNAADILREQQSALILFKRLVSWKKIQPSQKFEYQQTCAFCLGERLNAQINCGHNFHLACLAEWYTRKNICPLCQARFNEYKLFCPVCFKSYRKIKIRKILNLLCPVQVCSQCLVDGQQRD